MKKQTAGEVHYKFAKEILELIKEGRLEFAAERLEQVVIKGREVYEA